jgi:hypothetical protein
VILILASAWDEVAQALVRRWGAKAALLTPVDLSREGWRWQPGIRARNVAAIQRELVETSLITGVFTRLPAVSSKEIPHIIAHDREYVAAEMHAFLFAWLSGLPCPVVNRPSAYCLAGPYWKHEQWLHTAGQLGIDVEPAHRKITCGTLSRSRDVLLDNVTAITIAGNHHMGSCDPVLVGQARQVTAAAGITFSTILFRKAGATSKFLGVNLWPDVANPVIADLLFRVIQEQSRPDCSA